MTKQRTLVAPLVARILMSAIFLSTGIAKFADWSGTAAYMQSNGLPAVPVLLTAAAMIEIVGGLCLLLGLQARTAAMVLVLYLIPVTVVFHGFWSYTGMDRMIQTVNFMKNLAIMGGLCHVFAFGPGRISLDDRVRGEPREARPPLPAEPQEA
ncbi:MAG: DoxX family protein [Micrococcales bacterium]|nr:DoxX family protein [Micrococcales bacterium]